MRTSRKILLIFTALMVLMVVLVPGVLGWVIDQKLNSLTAHPEQVSPGFRLTQTHHKRHWWRSEVAYRILENDVLTGELFYDITVNGTIDHGPFLWRHKRFGLLGYQGELSYENEVLRSPATALANLKVSLLTTLVGALSLGQQDVLIGNQNFSVGQGEANFQYGFTGGTFSLDLDLKDLASPGQGFKTDGGILTFDLALNQADIWLGTMTATLAPVVMGKESFAASNSRVYITERGDVVAYEVSVALDDGEDVVYGPGRMDLKIDALDGPTLRELLDINAEIQEQTGNLEEQQNLQSQQLAKLPPLIRHGLAVSLSSFEVDTQFGTIKGSLDLVLPEGDGKTLSPALMAKGHSNLMVSKSLARYWRQDSIFSDAWRSAMASGLLKETPENYELEASYKDLALTVNGLKYPLPGLP